MPIPRPAPAAVTVSGQVTFDFVPVVAGARARLRRDGRAACARRHRRAAAKRRRHRQHDDGRNGQLFVRQRRGQHRRCAARASRDAACRSAELGFPRRRQRQRRRALYARRRRVQHGRCEPHAESACRIRLDGSRVHGDALGRAVRDPRRGLRRRAAGADRGAEHRVPGAALQLEHAERAGRRYGSRRDRLESLPDRLGHLSRRRGRIKTPTSTTGTSSRTSSVTISSIGSRARTASAGRTR